MLLTKIKSSTKTISKKFYYKNHIRALGFFVHSLDTLTWYGYFFIFFFRSNKNINFATKLNSNNLKESKD